MNIILPENTQHKIVKTSLTPINTFAGLKERPLLNKLSPPGAARYIPNTNSIQSPAKSPKNFIHYVPRAYAKKKEDFKQGGGMDEILEGDLDMVDEGAILTLNGNTNEIGGVLKGKYLKRSDHDGVKCAMFSRNNTNSYQKSIPIQREATFMAIPKNSRSEVPSPINKTYADKMIGRTKRDGEYIKSKHDHNTYVNKGFDKSINESSEKDVNTSQCSSKKKNPSHSFSIKNETNNGGSGSSYKSPTQKTSTNKNIFGASNNTLERSPSTLTVIQNNILGGGQMHSPGKKTNNTSGAGVGKNLDDIRKEQANEISAQIREEIELNFGGKTPSLGVLKDIIDNRIKKKTLETSLKNKSTPQMTKPKTTKSEKDGFKNLASSHEKLRIPKFSDKNIKSENTENARTSNSGGNPSARNTYRKANTNANIYEDRQDKSPSSNRKNGISGSASNKSLIKRGSSSLVRKGASSKAESSLLYSSTNSKKPKSSKKSPVKNAILSKEELAKYGDRTPSKYVKTKLIGKGGYAVVWEGQTQDKMVAMKQFPKISNDSKSKADIESCKNEIEVCEMLSDRKEEFLLDREKYAGVENISCLYDVIETKHDLWLIYELGGQSLSKGLFDLKGEFYKGERIYFIRHKVMYHKIRTNPNILKSIIKSLIEAIIVLNAANIVHCDLKADNVLVEINEKNELESLKIIDFGSCFIYNSELAHIKMSTPEYLCPELLDYLDALGNTSSSNNSHTSMFLDKINPWSIDVWSIGAIILEIINGFPLWLSLKSRIETSDGKSIIGKGLFAMTGRSGKKISERAKYVSINLDKIISECDCLGVKEDKHLMDLLKKLLCLNPLQRISPREALLHSYFK